MMTPKQRMLAVMNGEKPDEVPVATRPVRRIHLHKSVSSLFPE